MSSISFIADKIWRKRERERERERARIVSEEGGGQ